MSTQININKIPGVILTILKERGVEGAADITNFLYPKLKDLPPPALMKGMDKAVELIIAHLTAGKQIIIWGDYDVDGTTGTSLLVAFFKSLGQEVEWHIPSRLEEGYGLNIEWFLHRKKTDFLLITVDCGISDGQVISQIQRLGGSVIITDHHNLPDTALPDCVILNPSQKDCGFHREHLAGVGVAFYLAAGIRAKLLSVDYRVDSTKAINLKCFLAFVALGTIADVVPLSSTNRILVRGGIEALQCSTFKGIEALLKSCEIKNEKIGSEDIGFLIGPLINAAGRVGDSKTVVKLLTAETAAEAAALAEKLVRLNRKRKLICANDFEKAVETLSENRIFEEKCIVFKGNIHQGVAGIVASRLVDLYRVPTVVFAEKENPAGGKLLIGSARSVDGINVVKALSESSEFLLKYGGHDMAAGATLKAENFDKFSFKLKAVIVDMMSKRSVAKNGRATVNCSIGDLLSEEYMAFYELLEPFGPGNELPVFTDKNAKVIDCKRVGRGLEHLQIAVRGKYANYKGIGFGLGKRRAEIEQVPYRNIRYTPTKNRFRGRTSWQIRIIDL